MASDSLALEDHSLRPYIILLSNGRGTEVLERCEYQQAARSCEVILNYL